MAVFTSNYTGAQVDKGIGASYVPTLQNAPTSSTLTYTRSDLPSGRQTVNFEIGQFCRVADATMDAGYKFYQLYDLQSNGTVAVWQEMGTPLERTLLSVTSNNSSVLSSLRSSAVVTVTDEDDNEVFSGTLPQTRTLKLTPGISYTVSAAPVEGFTTPSSQTFEAEYEGIRNIDMEYNTMILTVNLTSDTGLADLSDVTITVTDTTASATVSPFATNQYKIPSGHGYSVSVSDDVEGYKAPDAATGTAASTTDAAQTITMTYEEFTGYVDLGLPSGKMWASGSLVKDSQGNYSIGEETDWGTYVSWGNIDGHNEGEGYDFSETNYNSTPGKALTADIPSSDSAHDICLARLGAPWRLPTKEEFKELYDNTDSEWVANYNGTGVAGRKFMKKSDHSVYVFFPASGLYNGTLLKNRGTYGLYWSSSFSSATYTKQLFFSSSSIFPQNSDLRFCGFTVRPIQLPHTNITITLNPIDESSVDNIQVTVTDQEGISHSGTTDFNGVATISNVGIGSCTVKAQDKGVSPKTITVAKSITSFAIDCHEAVSVSSYIIDQSNTDASPDDYIVINTPARNSNDADSVIHRIWSNTKLYAAATSLSNSKLQVRELNRSNKSQWTNGTSVSNNTTYDKFMKLPEFWWKCEEVAANTDQWRISFTMDNPDDNAWNHWEGNVFIGCYEAYNTSSKVYSRYNQTPTGNVSWTSFRSYATARGTGYTLVTYEAHTIMALLGYGWLGTTNDQSIVGYGSSTYPKTTGACDSKGIYDTSANVDGGSTAGAANNGESINFWGLENWWGDLGEFVDNLITKNKTGLVNVLSPGTSTVSRTVQCGTGGGCMTKAVMGSKGNMLMKANVSDSTYSKGYTSSSYVYALGDLVARRSYFGSHAAGGLGYLYIDDSESYTTDGTGSRLLYKGAWEENNTLT